mmetsp:Transcript_11624/g.18522  ORF Transcript_11624/g.18522 Transcript_11624/m.18522 type:complete len:302 (+) Transcript_11624:1785-2690(+)
MFLHLIDDAPLSLTCTFLLFRRHTKELELLLTHPHEAPAVNLALPVCSDSRGSHHLTLKKVVAAVFVRFFVPLVLPRVFEPRAAVLRFHDAHSATFIFLDDGHSLIRSQANLKRILFVDKIIWVDRHAENPQPVIDLVLLVLDLFTALLAVQEIPRHFPLDCFWVQLQVRQNLIKCHEAVLRARVEVDELLLQLQDPNDCAPQDLLDATALLRVNHLVVAVLQLPVDLQVLDVEQSKVLEAWLKGLAVLSCLRRQILDLHLLHELLHTLRPFVLIRGVRHDVVLNGNCGNVCTRAAPLWLL